jgi:hypothetical protein
MFDYRTKEGRGVTVYVRPLCKYGSAPEGSAVQVDAEEMDLAPTRATLWTAKERDAAAAVPADVELPEQSPLGEAIRKATASIPKRELPLLPKKKK